MAGFTESFNGYAVAGHLCGAEQTPIGLLSTIWPDSGDVATPSPGDASQPQHPRDAARDRDHRRIAAVLATDAAKEIGWTGYSSINETVVLDIETKGAHIKRRGREVRRCLRGLETVDSAWWRREFDCLCAFFADQGITGVYHGSFRLHSTPTPVGQLRDREKELAAAFGNDLRRAAQRRGVEVVVSMFECPPVPGSDGALLRDHVHFLCRGPWKAVQRLEKYMKERYVDAWIGRRARKPAAVSGYALKGPLSEKDRDSGEVVTLVDEFTPENLLTFWQQIKGLDFLRSYGAYRLFRRDYKKPEDEGTEGTPPAPRLPGAPRTGIRLLRTGYDHLPVNGKVELRKVHFVSVPPGLLDKMSGEEIFRAIARAYDIRHAQSWAASDKATDGSYGRSTTADRQPSYGDIGDIANTLTLLEFPSFIPWENSIQDDPDGDIDIPW